MAETPMVSFAHTEEQDLIGTTARQFLEERVPVERVRELMMSDDGFDRGLWSEMARLGWTGLAIPEEHGGAGFGLVEMSVLLEEMGRMVTPGPFFASAVLATLVVEEVANPDQRAEFLSAMATGETIATLAMFEQARDWSPREPSTKAARNGAGWLLDGAKRAVVSGDIANLLLATARTDDGVSVFAIPSDAEGLEVVAEPVLDPTRRQARLSLEAVQVPDEARLGEGDAGDALRRVLARATTALASEQVGGAQRCMEMSVEYAKSRYQFGRPIGSYQAIKHRCANMLLKIEHARSAAYHASRVAHDVDELAVAAPLAASLASEAYIWVAGENIQVHGGIGFTWEHDAHIYLKRAKSSSLLFGDPGYQRGLLGEAIGI